MTEAQAVKASREPNFALAKLERRALQALARHLPRWVLPDHLTALGVLSALGIGLAYVLSNDSVLWLWAVNALLLVHWFGDSLDGTLARVRKIERPRYGYYLDHLTDAISTAFIGIGLGLSPFTLLSTGLVIVVVYLVLSINVYLESFAFGEFKIGYGYLGPTEARIALFALNTLLAFGVGLQFQLASVGMSVLDVVGLAVAAVMLGALVVRAVRNLRQLAIEEPSARRRQEPVPSA